MYIVLGVPAPPSGFPLYLCSLNYRTPLPVPHSKIPSPAPRSPSPLAKDAAPIPNAFLGTGNGNGNGNGESCRDASMQHAIIRIDASLIPRDVSMFVYFFAGYIDAPLQIKIPASPVFTILLDDRTALKCRAEINQMNQINRMRFAFIL